MWILINKKQMRNKVNVNEEIKSGILIREKLVRNIYYGK